MMKKLFALIGTVLVFIASGCATCQKPTQASLSSVPVVQLGDLIPENREFILYFPAGKAIPTTVSIKGNIFAQEAEEVLNVTLRKDIYVYKDWISFDRINWLKGNRTVGATVEIKVPGYYYPKPGIIKIRMDENK